MFIFVNNLMLESKRCQKKQKVLEKQCNSIRKEKSVKNFFTQTVIIFVIFWTGGKNS